MTAERKHLAQDHPNVKPRVIGHILLILRQEGLAVATLTRLLWPLLLFFLIGIATFLYLARPLPPTKIRLATGQPNSSLDLLGNKIKGQFAKHGVEMELVSTAGAFENVELLRAGKVDAAFSLGGMVKTDASNLVSLGSVEYQPLWIFYRGLNLDGTNPADIFKNRTFSINIPGSGTRSMSERILGFHGIPIEGNPKVVSLSSAASVAALREGQIDGMFLVAGIESGTIKRLLDEPDIRVLDLAHAETYNKKMKFLERVTLPRGALDSVRDIPDSSKQLVATTTTILSTNALHPSIQNLFLSATKRIGDDGDAFFTRPGGFPAPLENDLALSKVAQRYYEHGPPFLHGHAPFWIASFLGEIGIVGLALVAIGIPVLSFVPKARIFYSRMCIEEIYLELRQLDQDMRKATTLQALERVMEKLDSFEMMALRLWTPVGTHDYFYKLRLDIDIVRKQTSQRIQHLSLDPRETGPVAPSA